MKWSWRLHSILLSIFLKSPVFLLVMIVVSWAIEHEFTSVFSPTAIVYAQKSNPALLGEDLNPASAFSLFSIRGILGNNKLVVPNPLSLITRFDQVNSWIANLLIESFELEGLTPTEVSKTISDQLKDGIDTYGSMTIDVLDYAHHEDLDTSAYGFGFNCQMATSGQVHIPGDFCKIIFSPTQGMQPGNILTFEDLESQAECATAFQISYGRTIYPRQKFLKQCKVSLGATISYYLGHFFWLLKMQNGEINYTSDNILSLHGNGYTIASDNPQTIFSQGVPIKGNGIGLTIGGIAVYKNYALSLNISDIGAMFWNTGMIRADFSIDEDQFYLSDLLSGNDSSIVSISKRKTDHPLTTPLPTRLLASISTRFDLPSALQDKLGNLSLYRICTIGYYQPLASRFSSSLAPKMVLKFENGFFCGSLPLHLGWILGGTEQWTSFVEVQMVGQELTYAIGYRTPGDGLFRLRKGFDFDVCARFMWDFW